MAASWELSPTVWLGIEELIISPSLISGGRCSAETASLPTGVRLRADRSGWRRARGSNETRNQVALHPARTAWKGRRTGSSPLSGDEAGSPGGTPSTLHMPTCGSKCASRRSGHGRTHSSRADPVRSTVYFAIGVFMPTGRTNSVSQPVIAAYRWQKQYRPDPVIEKAWCTATQ